MWLATRKKIGLLVLAAVFLPGAVYADETLTKQQGDAILEELKAIRVLLEKQAKNAPALQLRRVPLPDRRT